MGPELELFSCFTTLALHLEPPGRRSPAPSIGRPRVPTGTPTPGHSRLGEQLGHALAEAGQVGGGQAEVLGGKACGQDEKLVNFLVSKTGVCSHYSPKMVAFVGLFFPFHDPWGLSWGSPCFITSVLHFEPRGGRAAPQRLGRLRVPTGTATSRRARLGEQLGRSLEEAGQVGGGQAEVLGVHRSCGKTGTGEFSCFPLSPRTEFMMSCE